VSQKSLFILFLSALSFTKIQAQAVPQTAIVNHFTNSRCGVCANRNPGFYTNLRQQTNTLHIAFHPSSPYSTCVFSIENPSENDDRTNFYGIYGGTPRLVINGNVIPAAQNYALSAMFTPYQGLTSPFAARRLLFASRSARRLYFYRSLFETKLGFNCFTNKLSASCIMMRREQTILFYRLFNIFSVYGYQFSQSFTAFAAAI
jgi:hypothetical protein